MPNLPSAASLRALTAWDTPTICNALELTSPDRRAYGFTVSNGFDMFGGRSHVEWAVTYNDSPQTVFMTSAHWFNNPALIANPLYNATTNPNVPPEVALPRGTMPSWLGCTRLISTPACGMPVVTFSTVPSRANTGSAHAIRSANFMTFPFRIPRRI